MEPVEPAAVSKPAAAKPSAAMTKTTSCCCRRTCGAGCHRIIRAGWSTTWLSTAWTLPTSTPVTPRLLCGQSQRPAKKNGTIFRDPTVRVRVGQQLYGVILPLQTTEIADALVARLCFDFEPDIDTFYADFLGRPAPAAG